MADLDGNGLLDLFCGNYDLGSRVDMDSLTNPGQGNTLHQNLGKWRFQEVGQAAGVRQTGLAFAQANSIESFNVTQQGGKVIVRIQTKTPLPAVPPNFTVASPARIAIDFAKTSRCLLALSRRSS